MLKNIFLLFALFSFTRLTQAQDTLSRRAALLFKTVKSKLTVVQKNAIVDSMAFLLSKDGKQFIDAADDEDHPFYASVLIADLNKDEKQEVFITWGNTFTSGITGSSVSLFIQDQKGVYHPNLGFPGCCISFLPGKYVGYPDIVIGMAGLQFPVWHWDGNKYVYLKTIRDDSLDYFHAVPLQN